MTLCGRRTLCSELGVAPVPAEVRPLRPRTVWLSFEVLGSAVASLLVSFPRLVRQAFERLEPCEGKLSCTVLRGGAVGNDGSLLDQDTASSKQPWYFTARDGSPVLTIAGLWDQWKNKETGERIKSCTMIIGEPNDFVAEVHDRMPVLLAPEQFEHWLSGDMGVEELKPAPNDYLQRWPVSKRVNSSKADKDDASLIERVELATA